MSTIDIMETKKKSTKLIAQDDSDKKKTQENDVALQFGGILAQKNQKNQHLTEKISDINENTTTNDPQALNSNTNGNVGMPHIRYSKMTARHLTASQEEDARRKAEHDKKILQKKELIQKEFEKNQKVVMINFLDASKSNEAKVFIIIKK